MSDLISRSALIKEFEIQTNVYRPNGLWHITGIRAMIEAEPTAFDLEAVMNQLEVLHDLVNMNQKLAVSQAIDIVRKCGADMRKKVEEWQN